MNVYDSARMADLLAGIGYAMVDSDAEADLVILNTCHIREKAAEKMYSELGRLRRLKSQSSDRKVLLAVAGCVAQAEGAEVLARAPFVDIVVGPHTYHRLPELVARAHRAAGAVLETEFPAEPKFDALPDPVLEPGAASAYLTVQEGCDKFCTFCVVPYTRGAEYSRPFDDVLREAAQYVCQGVRELTLLGQNVNAYQGMSRCGSYRGLAGLIQALANIAGIERIRYTTSHPADHDEALIAAHGEVAQLMPYLHLPVQSGSNRILAAMNRRHRAEDYLRLIERLRKARPDLALSSDFIVGFPGETDRDFAETLRLVEDVRYAQAYSFKYSPRPGTPAASETDQVPEQVKHERLQVLQQVLSSQQRDFNRSMIGRDLAVLLESRGRKPGQLLGRSPYMQAVHVQAPDALLRQVVSVRITAAGPNSLAAVLPAGVCC